VTQTEHTNSCGTMERQTDTWRDQLSDAVSPAVREIWYYVAAICLPCKL